MRMELIDDDQTPEPDPTPVDPADVLAGQLNAVNAQLVTHTVDALATGSWEQAGRRSPASYLQWRFGLSPERAKLVVDVASRFDEFPTLMAAFVAGELSFEQTAEAIKAPAWADADILDFCRIATVSKIRNAMRSNMFEGDPDEPAPAKPAPADRVSFGIGRDGRWRIRGNLDIAQGRRIEAALTERKDALHTERRHNNDHHDDNNNNETAESDTEHPDRATWADALVECCERSLDTVDSTSRRDQYRTWLHIDVTNGDATTTDGWRIPQALERNLVCDGIVQPVWETNGIPFSVGNSQRIVPDRTRRIIQKRDRGCRVPGCTAERYVEIHHIIHWLDGGPTDTWNLLSLCPWHHKMHHQGKLDISGNADDFDGVTFTDAEGRVITARSKPVTPTGTLPTTQVPYQHPLAGRFNWNWIGLGWIHPNAIHKRRQQLAEHWNRIDTHTKAA